MLASPMSASPGTLPANAPLLAGRAVILYGTRTTNTPAPVIPHLQKAST